MKVVVDMNLSTDWVNALRAGGIDAVHWAALGRFDASDDSIMDWAFANKATILTRDLDFAAAVMLRGRTSPSVVQLRIDQLRPERHLPLVQRALSLHQRRIEQGAIVTLDEERVRIRVLHADPDF